MLDLLDGKKLLILIEEGKKRGYDTVTTVRNVDYLMEMEYYNLSIDEAYKECLDYIRHMKKRG